MQFPRWPNSRAQVCASAVTFSGARALLAGAATMLVQASGCCAVVFLQRSMLFVELLLRHWRGAHNAEAVNNAMVRGHLACNRSARVRLNLRGCTQVTAAVFPGRVEARELVLSQMKIVSAVCEAWFTAIARQCPSLTVLRLDENGFGPQGARALALALPRLRSVLRACAAREPACSYLCVCARARDEKRV